MKVFKVNLILSLLVLLIGVAFGSIDTFAEGTPANAPVVSLKEMPLLRGDTWLKMTHDEKVAFVWGMGHVITMERESSEKYPELKNVSIAVMMAKGLAGMPMNEVVSTVDGFYKANPSQSIDPVVKVIWDTIVASKLEPGSTDTPTK